MAGRKQTRFGDQITTTVRIKREILLDLRAEFGTFQDALDWMLSQTIGRDIKFFKGDKKKN